MLQHKEKEAQINSNFQCHSIGNAHNKKADADIKTVSQTHKLEKCHGHLGKMLGKSDDNEGL